MRQILLILCYLLPLMSIAQAPNYDSLRTVLEKIYEADQQPRVLMDSLQKRYSFSSPEMQQLMTSIKAQDSINAFTVAEIIDKYGWIEKEKTSVRANEALFLVIQHADLQTQLKYLPLLHKASQEGKAKASQYALLLDRTNLKQGKFQVYGSQLSSDESGEIKFSPIIDEPKVNERRKAVGLNTMEEYAKRFGLTYTLPSIDTLKNKGLLMITVWYNGGRVDDVDIYLGNMLLGKTDAKGNYQKAIEKTLLPAVLTFKKEGFKLETYALDDTSKDIFEINYGILHN